MLKLKAIFGAIAMLSLTAAAPANSYQPEPKLIENKLNSYDMNQIRCMAQNMYFEARGEPLSGQIAVSHVVLNRIKSDKFPDTPCGVIKQRSSGGCQFSWVCSNNRIKNTVQYSNMLKLAEDIYEGEYRDNTRGALYYHATYVRPYWAYIFTKTARIGSHIFYKG